MPMTNFDCLICKTLSGKEFNEIYKDLKFVKLTNLEEVHNGFAYKSGLNEDTVKFYPLGQCNKGGMYFCYEFEIFRWIDYGCGKMVWCRNVEIPNDAQVYEEGRKFKADKFILGEKILIDDYLNHDICMYGLTKYSKTIMYIPNRLKTPTLCDFALSQCGCNLKYVPQEYITQEMCKNSVKNCIDAFDHVPEKNKTEELCLYAIKKFGKKLEFVPNEMRTKELCETAVKECGLAFAYVPEKFKTQEMYISVIKNGCLGLEDVPNVLITGELCELAVKRNGLAYRYVPNEYKTPVLCKIVMQNYLWNRNLWSDDERQEIIRIARS